MSKVKRYSRYSGLSIPKRFRLVRIRFITKFIKYELTEIRVFIHPNIQNNLMITDSIFV